MKSEEIKELFKQFVKMPEKILHTILLTSAKWLY